MKLSKWSNSITCCVLLPAKSFSLLNLPMNKYKNNFDHICHCVIKQLL